MATTMVAMVIRRDELTVANVGDSRAYLLRDGEIQQITQDHSLVAGLLADGIITPEEAVNHPQRNVILYSLGSAPHEPRIDIFRLKLRPGDLVLACTDGLTRYTDKEKLLALLNEGDPAGAAQRLIDFANDSGGADNVTVALLRIRKRALPRWVWWFLLAFGIGLIALSGLAGLALTGWNLWGS
jgi:protein phosphatase